MTLPTTSPRTTTPAKPLKPLKPVKLREHTATLPHDQCYRAVQSRDARFDGWFVTAVHTTGIYCRPSCPAMTPKPANVSFFATAAAAQQRGFRACKRCRPDASPGSPEWNGRADVVARAMRSIADGVVDRDGVAGLSRQLGYSERHLSRLMTDELGAGPLAIARAQRAQTARLLVETTALPMTDIAFAAGFSSIRQFNDTIREVFDSSPSGLRARRTAGALPSGPGAVSIRLPVREPFDSGSIFAFLGAGAVAGVEHFDGTTYSRSLRLARGSGAVSIRVGSVKSGEPLSLQCTLRLGMIGDLQSAVQRCRRLFDLDADPVAVDAVLGDDPALAALVAKRPGLRSPGAVDGGELLVRAILGQQVSVAGARTLAGRLTAEVDDSLLDLGLDVGEVRVTHLFPTPEALLELDPSSLPMPEARRRALRSACTAVVDGRVVIDTGTDRQTLVDDLQRLPGIGPWTAAHVALRGLGDPDIFMPTDLGVRRGLDAIGMSSSPAAAMALAQRWRPWRSYALHHLWANL